MPSKLHHLCLVLDVKTVQASPLQQGLFVVVSAGGPVGTVRFGNNEIPVSNGDVSGSFAAYRGGRIPSNSAGDLEDPRCRTLRIT